MRKCKTVTNYKYDQFRQEILHPLAVIFKVSLERSENSLNITSKDDSLYHAFDFINNVLVDAHPGRDDNHITFNDAINRRILLLSQLLAAIAFDTNCSTNGEKIFISKDSQYYKDLKHLFESSTALANSYIVESDFSNEQAFVFSILLARNFKIASSYHTIQGQKYQKLITIYGTPKWAEVYQLIKDIKNVYNTDGFGSESLFKHLLKNAYPVISPFLRSFSGFFATRALYEHFIENLFNLMPHQMRANIAKAAETRKETMREEEETVYPWTDNAVNQILETFPGENEKDVLKEHLNKYIGETCRHPIVHFDLPYANKDILVLDGSNVAMRMHADHGLIFDGNRLADVVEQLESLGKFVRVTLVEWRVYSDLQKDQRRVFGQERLRNLVDRDIGVVICGKWANLHAPPKNVGDEGEQYKYVSRDRGVNQMATHYRAPYEDIEVFRVAYALKGWIVSNDQMRDLELVEDERRYLLEHRLGFEFRYPDDPNKIFILGIT